MNYFEEHTKAILEQVPHERIILGCSGGVDSMTLFSLFLKLGVTFEVAHVNYQLRKEDADLDEQLVAQHCKRNKIPFHLKKIDLGEQLSIKGGNLQNEARKARHSFFQQLLNNNKDKIALAHNQDDQIESFFLGLARGGNTNALAGMKEIEGNLIRPLLKFSRREILAYAKENKIEWREDASNAKNEYARNKLRNIFIPQLLAQQPDLKKDVLLLMEAFQTAQLQIETTIQPLLNKVKETQLLHFSEFDHLHHDELLELLRQLKLTGVFAKELHKLRKAERGKFLFVAKQQLKIVREKDCFKFVS